MIRRMFSFALKVAAHFADRLMDAADRAYQRWSDAEWERESAAIDAEYERCSRDPEFRKAYAAKHGIKEREDPPYDYYYTSDYLRLMGHETYRNAKVESQTITPTEADWQKSRETGVLPMGFKATFTCLARMLTDDPIERQWSIDNGYTDEQGFALKPIPAEARKECRAYCESKRNSL